MLLQRLVSVRGPLGAAGASSCCRVRGWLAIPTPAHCGLGRLQAHCRPLCTCFCGRRHGQCRSRSHRHELCGNVASTWSATLAVTGITKRTQHLLSSQSDSGPFWQRVWPRTLGDLELSAVQFRVRHRQQVFTLIRPRVGSLDRVHQGKRLPAMRLPLEELTGGGDKLFLEGGTGWLVWKTPSPCPTSRILADSITLSKGPSLETKPPGADMWSDKIGPLPHGMRGDHQVPRSPHAHTANFLASDSQYDSYTSIPIKRETKTNKRTK